MIRDTDVLIIGGGAAGLMCAIETGKRGRRVLLLEHSGQIGEKIRISGGGRCNFTNRSAEAENFISQNPHFCRSALTRYTSQDFIDLVERHGIAYHVKKEGQLFCDGSSREIIGMLERECAEAGVLMLTSCEIGSIKKDARFEVETSEGMMHSSSLVIATGGLSIPQIGATSLGYKIAKQFELGVTSLRPGLVPLLFAKNELALFGKLSGISVDAEVRCGDSAFRENILFTHRGLSGPAILQASSYWKDGESITINLLPDLDAFGYLKERQHSARRIESVLEDVLPRRFVALWCAAEGLSKPLGQYSLNELSNIAGRLCAWTIVPAGTEGFGKAEVTTGGIDTKELSSKTMEANRVPGLYFIGEVVDVTGWLGGYNFQWAWSSGFVAGQYA